MTKQRLSAITGWLIFVFCTSCYVASWYLYHRMDPQTLSDFADYTGERWINFGPMVVFPLAAALILSFRPWHPIGLVFAVAGLTSTVEFLATPYLITSWMRGNESLPATGLLTVLRNILWVFLPASLSILLVLFPDGRLLNKYWGGLLVFVTSVSAAIMLIGAIEIWPHRFESGSFYNQEYPYLNILFYLLVMAIPAALASLYFRWRTARETVRQQIQWLMWGGLIMVISLGVLVSQDLIGSRLPRLLENFLGNSVFLAVPTTMVVAILRHRLFDIDLLIRRTLLYTALSALLAILYYGLVVLLQAVVGRTIGGHSPLIIVISTLSIAALFNPLRHRVQTAIDRRLYRRKYDRRQVLADFARTARDEVSLESLEEDLALVVLETLQPAVIGLWLRQEA